MGDVVAGPRFAPHTHTRDTAPAALFFFLVVCACFYRLPQANRRLSEKTPPSALRRAALCCHALPVDRSLQVLTVLLKHRCGATTAFVNEGGVELFGKMVRHLGNFSVMQVAKLLLLPKYAALQGEVAPL